MTNLPAYVLLAPESAPSEISAFDPFRALVIIERPVSTAWRDRISDWLVRSGRLHMMAWDENCSAWDDAVDFANMELFGFGDIPGDRDVMTTWHTEESFEEVVFLRKTMHPIRLLIFSKPFSSIFPRSAESRSYCGPMLQ